MRAWINAHVDALALTLRQLWRRPVSALLGIAVIAVGLLLPLSGYVVLVNVKAWIGAAGLNPVISVLLAAGAAEPERTALERSLRAESRIRQARYVSKETALKELESRLDSTDLLAGLGANPLPDAWLVTPQDRSVAGQEALAATIRGWPAVARVEIDAIWSQRIQSLVRAGEGIVLGIGVALALAMLAISFNTINLQVLTRSEEIAVLRLFGATSAQVRRPFLYFGAFQGLLAGIFAWSALATGMYWVEPRLEEVLKAYGYSSRLTGLGVQDGCSILIFSAIIGLAGAWLAEKEY